MYGTSANQKDVVLEISNRAALIRRAEHQKLFSLDGLRYDQITVIIILLYYIIIINYSEWINATQSFYSL